MEKEKISDESRQRTALSFDIGTRNLAYCVLSWSPKEQTYHIRDWNVLDIRARTIDAMARKILKLVGPLLTDDIDLVVIERQVPRSTKMRGVSYMIFMHFLTRFNGTQRDGAVHFINPKHKLTVYRGPEIEVTLKDPYRRRKRLAVEHCKALLHEQGQEERLQEFLDHAKKDDLADAFLQAAYFLQEESKPKPKKRKRAAKKKTTKVKKRRAGTTTKTGDGPKAPRIIDLTKE